MPMIAVRCTITVPAEEYVMVAYVACTTVFLRKCQGFTPMYYVFVTVVLRCDRYK